ncbi:hypothetical protein EYV94_07535 [Puteibacter caeruleilacunae]|nr:hypothetical protein EYV94_07535 [Puteibacter caeruleilacunae]
MGAFSNLSIKKILRFKPMGIKVVKVKTDLEVMSAELAGKLLEKQTSVNFIDKINWDEYPYKPEVKFRIGHTDSEVLVKFYVREKNILAQETKINGDVYKDSCVEFFLSPLADGNYYNFEFSCIGTPHVGYGEGRHNRIPVPNDKVELIQVESSLGSEPFAEKQGDYSWELTVVIPKEVMVNNSLDSLNGLQAKGNFYKCGDETSDMHFVTWNPVGTEGPDYHQYGFFGDLDFE